MGMTPDEWREWEARRREESVLLTALLAMNGIYVINPDAITSDISSLNGTRVRVVKKRAKVTRDPMPYDAYITAEQAEGLHAWFAK